MTKAEDLAALGEVERKAKISRTDTQAGVGGAALVVFCFVAAYFRLDLNPFEKGYQDAFPITVQGAFFVIGTAIAVRVMNRPKTDLEAGQADLIALVATILWLVIGGIVLYRLCAGDPVWG